MQTECSADLFGFAPVEGRKVVAAFDGGRMTSEAGALLLGATDGQLRLVERFAGCFTDCRAAELVEHTVARLVGQRVFGMALGYEDGKKAEVESLAARALAEFGRVDILINNAAIRPHKPFTESTDADWELIRSVVLDGPLHLTRALIEPMVENRYGRILFFCGDGSISASGSGRTHLSAAKMGLIGMARGLASEFAPHNIRVNIVSPGSIDTRRDHPEWYHGRLPNAVGIPLGRQGTVDEIAATCLFLVSEDGGFITGQTIHVNGGAHYY